MVAIILSFGLSVVVVVEVVVVVKVVLVAFEVDGLIVVFRPVAKVNN